MEVNNKLKYKGKEMPITGVNKRGLWIHVTPQEKAKMAFENAEAKYLHKNTLAAREQNKQFAKQ